MKTEYYDFHGKCSISSETLNRGFTPAAVAPPECDKLLDTCYIIIAPERRGGKEGQARSPPLRTVLPQNGSLRREISGGTTVPVHVLESAGENFHTCR